MNEQPSFRAYGTQVIANSLQDMLSHVSGVRAADDIEAVHDMRVASRRLRAALDVFSPAFTDPQFPRFIRDVKGITDALGVARDLDVMIDDLEKLAASLPEEERRGVESLVDEKKRERERRQKDVLRALNEVEKRDLGRRFAQIAAHSTEPATKPSPKHDTKVVPKSEPPETILVLFDESEL